MARTVENVTIGQSSADAAPDSEADTIRAIIQAGQGALKETLEGGA